MTPAMNECEYCRRPGHVWFQCPKKPDGWKPARLAKRSGRGLLVPSNPQRLESATRKDAVLPVPTPKPRRKDTRKGDRHSPGYMAKYMREYRAKLKAQKEMGK